MADKPCVLRTRSIQTGGHSRQWNPRTKRVDYAHRVAWETENGPIPEGFEVHHKCEQPACVEPEHLECVAPDKHRHRHGKAAKAKCGTYSGYVVGCRCASCRVANRKYKREHSKNYIRPSRRKD